LVSAKLNEDVESCPSIYSLQRIVRNRFTWDKFVDKEKEIIEILDWKLNVITPYCVKEYIPELTKFENKNEFMI